MESSVSVAESESSHKLLWSGWLKKIGRFSKRWIRRYFALVSSPEGLVELRYFDSYRDNKAAILSHPRGVMGLDDAIGVCYLDNASKSRSKRGLARKESASSSLWGSDPSDHKFAILCHQRVWLLGFQHGGQWESTSEFQQGLALLATISALFPPIEVLHSGWMTKKRERTGPSPNISYWKKHFFVFLASGDLLYFPDENMAMLQGRVDVKNASTVRVSGQINMQGDEEYSKIVPRKQQQDCLVWIATPPSKLFILKVLEKDTLASSVVNDARKWIKLLMRGHAHTKYTQLEHCVSQNVYDRTPEIVSAVRAGNPEELRGSLWKGFSGANDLRSSKKLTTYEMFCDPIDIKIENDHVLEKRLVALAIYDIDGDTDSLALISSLELTTPDFGMPPPVEDDQTWEEAARKRVLMACTRYQQYSHPVGWKVLALLLAYMDETSCFWVINSIIDLLLPGYFHGYRPALLIDTSVVEAILLERTPVMYNKLRGLNFPFTQVFERWFLSLFTSSELPLSTVLRIWDAFFLQGVSIFYGVAFGLFLKAEDQLLTARSSDDALSTISGIEKGTLDAGLLFSQVFTADLKIIWLKQEQLVRLRTTHRAKVLDIVSRHIEMLNQKLALFAVIEEQCQTHCEFISKCADLSQQSSELTARHFNTLHCQLQQVANQVSRLVQQTHADFVKYVALSSQLKACPLGLSANSSDLHSWLCQVKDGKIVGAGDEENEGLSPVHSLLAMKTNEYDIRMLLQRMLTAGKMACATSLACCVEAQKHTWYGGTWISTPVSEMSPRQTKAGSQLEEDKDSDSDSDTAPIFLSYLSTLNAQTRPFYRDLSTSYAKAVETYQSLAETLARQMRELNQVVQLNEVVPFRSLEYEIQTTCNEMRGPECLQSY